MSTQSVLKALFALITITVLATVTAGCGSEGPGVGRVSGTVKFKDQLLTSGDVVFLLPNGEKKGSPLSDKGTYTAENIPVGVVKIAVITRPHVPPGLKKAGSPPDREANAFVHIPAKYADADKSGLRYEVKAGSHEYNIVLNP
jgi:hypothetical protein